MMTKTGSAGFKTVNVLLVEDNPGDITLVEEALVEMDQKVDLRTAVNGDQAMSSLRRQGNFADFPRPDIVVLDLNLPVRNGLEVLREIKTDEALKDIPVVIFTTSRSHRDILRAYGWGSTFFITKPLGFHEYMEAVKSIISNAHKFGGKM